jgi:hypothetical protein
VGDRSEEVMGITILRRNWGLVTYREVALLVDTNSSVITKQRVAYVVAHERKFFIFTSLPLRLYTLHLDSSHLYFSPVSY